MGKIETIKTDDIILELLLKENAGK